MATYGLTGSGQVPFSGWSPTLGMGAANQASGNGAIQFNGLSQQDEAIAGTLNNQANRRLRALIYGVLGAVPGSPIVATYARVLAQQAMNNPFALGGLVPIETANYVSRVTTAADVTAIKALLDRIAGFVVYPADLSMNGGSAGIGGPNSKVLW